MRFPRVIDRTLAHVFCENLLPIAKVGLQIVHEKGFAHHRTLCALSQ